ncbi:MAG: metallophosphoesterase [Elusimicrobia bacterium]|nr:metallophosphoesterase [Elusimicrobiota bacterium]
MFDFSPSLTLPWDIAQRARDKLLEPVSFRRTRLSPEMELAAAPWKTTHQIQRIQNASKSLTKPLRFVVLGDSGPARFWFGRLLWPTPNVYERLLNKVQNNLSDTPFDFSVHVGDQLTVGKLKEYKRLLQILSDRVTWPYLTVIGNHERSAPHAGGNNKLYRSVFGDPDYTFDHGGVRFVVLDTSLGKLNPDQLKWLDQVLRTDQRKIVFTHEPPDVFKQWTRFLCFKGGGFRDGSDEFVELMAKHRVDRVYMGHVHHFGFMEWKGVRYVLSGSSGSPLYPLPARGEKKFFNYILVEITSNSIQETVYKLDDSFFTLLSFLSSLQTRMPSRVTVNIQD